MKRVHRIVVAAVLGWFASAGLATAEPISITSGVLTLSSDQTASVPMTLSGTDGVRSFAFRGFIESDLAYGVYECKPCGRTATGFSIAIPGFGATNAQDLIAETGVDMSVFPTAGHLCSWARVTPRVTESGGRRKGKSATGRGNPCIGAALGEAASSAGRTHTFLAARYRRLIRHMPKKKAQVAIMRTQLAAAHALLSDPQAEYRDPGPGYYEQQQDARRLTRGHVRGLERLGWKVTLEPVDPGTGELTARTAG